jgi:hypothetical protein
MKNQKQKSDIFIRESPPEVIKYALELRRKACGLRPIDYVREFTI